MEISAKLGGEIEKHNKNKMNKDGHMNVDNGIWGTERNGNQIAWIMQN